MEFEGESPGSHNATAVEYDDYRQQVTDKILEERRSQCHLLSDTFYINGQLINRPLLDGGVTFENAVQLIEAGADSIVCGAGTVFKDKNGIMENTSGLRKLVDNT